VGIGTGWWTDAYEESFAAVYAVESESVGGTAVFAFSFKGASSCAAVDVIYRGLLWSLWCKHCGCLIVYGNMRDINSRVIPPNDPVLLQKITILLLPPHPEKETQDPVQRIRDESVSAM